MKKTSYLVVLIVAVLFISTKVNAIEDSSIVKDMLDDGVLNVKMLKPSNGVDLDSKLNAYIFKSMREDNYINAVDYKINFADIDYNDKNFDVINVKLVLTDLKTNKEYSSKLSYVELDKKIAEKVEKVATKIKEKDMYTVEDLSMVNFYYNVGKRLEAAEHVNYVAAFSDELKKVVGNSNVSFSYDARMGIDLPFIPIGNGYFVLFYDDVAYDSIQMKLSVKNIIYVPDNTEDTTEAYVAAAQKRIDDYLGKDKVKIVSAGKITDSDYDFLYSELALENNNRDEFFYLTVGESKFEFLITKDSSKMITPVYETNDLTSGINISSDSKRIPLDAKINVDKLEKDSKEYKNIDEKIDGEIYDVVDIKLYSSIIRNYVKELEDGTFDVSLPLTEDMKDKKLVACYVNEEEKVEEHEVTIKDGFAVFNTDHFSIYTLAEANEKVKEEVPNTIDGIVKYIILGIVSLLGLIVGIKYLNKESKVN